MSNIDSETEFEEEFLDFEREFKENHPELNDAELKTRCEQEWGKLSTVQKALFQLEPKEPNALLYLEKESKEKQEWDKLPTVENELFQNGPSCSVNCIGNQRLCGSIKPRQAKAKAGRIKKKPYDRPVKPKKNKKATKEGNDCNRRPPYTNNGFLNYLREMDNANKDIDGKTLVKQCIKGWSEFFPEQKDNYRKKGRRKDL